MEPEVSKIVSRSVKVVRGGSDIHDAFHIIYDDEIHGKKLNFHLALDPEMEPHL